MENRLFTIDATVFTKANDSTNVHLHWKRPMTLNTFTASDWVLMLVSCLAMVRDSEVNKLSACFGFRFGSHMFTDRCIEHVHGEEVAHSFQAYNL
ncbi:hypothetical protein TNCV_1299671 [Trichonephila clavipes]|nr:hypothetical protein TNCV_1299671 [Trichonephila clavipes]